MNKKIKILVGVLSFLILGVSTVLAINSWDTGYQVSTGSHQVRYTSSNLCKSVNNGTGETIFVGTKTSGELNSVANNPNISLSSCERNLALGKYVHTTAYNNIINTATDCSNNYWDGLTDGRIASTRVAECYNTAWVSGSFGNNDTYDKYVSLDLGGTYSVNRVRVYGEKGPLLNNSGGYECSGYDNNSKTVYAYVKNSSDCSWNSGGWTSIGSATNSSSGGTVQDINFSYRSVRCVRLRYVGSYHQWRDCEGLGSRGYIFSKELQVFGH